MNNQLAKQEGYDHVYSFSTNFKSASSFKKLGFSKMAELNAQEFKFGGVDVLR